MVKMIKKINLDKPYVNKNGDCTKAPTFHTFFVEEGTERFDKSRIELEIKDKVDLNDENDYPKREFRIWDNKYLGMVDIPSMLNSQHKDIEYLENEINHLKCKNEDFKNDNCYLEDRVNTLWWKNKIKKEKIERLEKENKNCRELVDEKIKYYQNLLKEKDKEIGKKECKIEQLKVQMGLDFLDKSKNYYDLERENKYLHKKLEYWIDSANFFNNETKYLKEAISTIETNNLLKKNIKNNIWTEYNIPKYKLECIDDIKKQYELIKLREKGDVND